MNVELESIWKEVVVACARNFTRIIAEGLRNSTKRTKNSAAMTKFGHHHHYHHYYCVCCYDNE
jgi:hypothetical protein